MRAVKFRHGQRCLAVVLALGGAGCASVPRSGMQTLEIEAVSPAGVALADARCSLRNGLGEWAAAAPGKVTLSTDASPLQLRCEAAAARGELSASADVRGGRGGRALVGGGIGLAVGGLVGHSQDSKDSRQWCCGNLGAVVGAVLGTAIGAGVGAGTAEPTYAYPARLRVVLQPDSPPR